MVTLFGALLIALSGLHVMYFLSCCCFRKKKPKPVKKSKRSNRTKPLPQKRKSKKSTPNRLTAKPKKKIPIKKSKTSDDGRSRPKEKNRDKTKDKQDCGKTDPKKQKDEDLDSSSMHDDPTIPDDALLIPKKKKVGPDYEYFGDLMSDQKEPTTKPKGLPSYRTEVVESIDNVYKYAPKVPQKVSKKEVLQNTQDDYDARVNTARENINNSLSEQVNTVKEPTKPETQKFAVNSLKTGLYQIKD